MKILPHPRAACLGLSLLLCSALRAPAGDGSGPAMASTDAAPDAITDDGDAALVTTPALALAEVYAPGADLSAYLVSEKLDGVRAYWDGARLITRGGRVINAPDWFTAGLPPVALDGELWLGRGRFAAVSGAARRLEPEPETWRHMRYMLFDLPGADDGFETRLALLGRLIDEAGGAHVQLVEQAPVADHDALMALLERVVAGGGEGLMLHRRDAPYRPGRGSDLLKVKPYLEAEARVVDHVPGRGKYQGMMGSLLVALPDGRRFRIGTGFSDAERAEPPPVGSAVSFKYHGLTKYGLPRFASFLRVADDL
jgi:DNA ligase-1